MTRRAVVKADWYTARSILQNWRPAARWWRLTLECGHTETRPFRYVGSASIANATQFSIDTAKPAPQRVLCHRCTEEQ